MVLLQYAQIFGYVVGFDLGDQHAPLDATLQRTPLVQAEIVRGPGPQQIDDRCQAVFFGGVGRNMMDNGRLVRQRVAIAQERVRNFIDRQHAVH